MSPRPIDPWLQPGTCPRERPPLESMDRRTVELHRSIDDAMRRTGQPYLHPEGETLQRDLLGSTGMVAWQEAKAERVFDGERCWSDLPQIYARYGTETTRTLIGEVRRLENAAAAVLTDCGMQACALLFDVVLEPGTHAVVCRQVYNKTKRYLERLGERQACRLTVVDDGEYDAIAAAIEADTRLVFCETFTNPLTRAVDPERMGHLVDDARASKARGVRLVIDSTIATPWSLERPLLDWPGVDFVVASGTKALGGEDRDLWGYVASNRIEPMNALMDLQAMRGGILDWRRARAILDALPRARERFATRCQTARQVARFLAAHPAVSEVFHPSLPDHPDRAVVERRYALEGSLLSFRLKDAGEDDARRFCDVLAMTQVPRYALSFDGLVTKLNHHRTVSEYFTPEEEILRAGIERLVRLGVGLEAPEDIAACLNWALCHWREIRPEEIERWREARCRELGIYPAAPSA